MKLTSSLIFYFGLFADDTIHSVVDTLKGAKSLYTESSEAIHDTLQMFAGDSAAGKLVDSWLGTADRVISGLDQLAKSQPFPFIGRKLIVVIPDRAFAE